MEHTLTQVARSYALLQQLIALEASNNDGNSWKQYYNVMRNHIHHSPSGPFLSVWVCAQCTHTHTCIHGRDTRTHARDTHT